jgi:hypothetical protein
LRVKHETRAGSFVPAFFYLQIGDVLSAKLVGQGVTSLAQIAKRKKDDIAD